MREVEPGEMVIIDERGLRSERPFRPQAAARRCVFEHIYFARPGLDPLRHVGLPARERLGRRLAVEHPVEADLVIPVPDSGVPAAIGYAEQSGIPFDQGLMRSHYVGRTFIEPSQQIRHFGVKLKLTPVRDVLQGQAGGGGRRLDRARHHLPQDREDDPRRRRDARCTCASPRRPPPGPATTASTRPTREELIASSHTVRRDRAVRHRRLARLPVARGAVRAVNGAGADGRGGRLLRRLLLGRVPDRRSSSRRGCASCA